MDSGRDLNEAEKTAQRGLNLETDKQTIILRTREESCKRVFNSSAEQARRSVLTRIALVSERIFHQGPGRSKTSSHTLSDDTRDNRKDS